MSFDDYTILHFDYSTNLSTGYRKGRARDIFRPDLRCVCSANNNLSPFYLEKFRLFTEILTHCQSKISNKFFLKSVLN